jgi:hypothetical protein
MGCEEQTEKNNFSASIYARVHLLYVVYYILFYCINLFLFRGSSVQNFLLQKYFVDENLGHKKGEAALFPVRYTRGGFVKGILGGARWTKSLRELFLHRRPPSWTTLVLYSRAVFIFNEPAFSPHPDALCFLL